MKPDNRMLPTPTAMDANASGGSNESNVTLTDAVVRTNLGKKPNERLLPTPKAGDGEFATPSTTGRPHHNATHLSTRIVKGGEVLLPTPEAKLASSGPDYARMNREGAGGDDLTTTIWREGMHDPPLTPESAMGITNWGPYAAAIDRWERVLGRPAPAPVRYDGKGGKPRLNPELTEWMMGWPEGHVTDPAIGLTRAEQLKACGNGVVPQQAAEALHQLLSRPGVPSVEWELAA